MQAFEYTKLAVAQGPTNNILFVSKEDYEYTVWVSIRHAYVYPPFAQSK